MHHCTGGADRRATPPSAPTPSLPVLLSLHVTPADVDGRAAVKRLAADIRDPTGDTVRLAYVDQGYAGEVAGLPVSAKRRGVLAISLGTVQSPQRSTQAEAHHDPAPGRGWEPGGAIDIAAQSAGRYTADCLVLGASAIRPE